MKKINNKIENFAQSKNYVEGKEMQVLHCRHYFVENFLMYKIDQVLVLSSGSIEDPIVKSKITIAVLRD